MIGLFKNVCSRFWWSSFMIALGACLAVLFGAVGVTSKFLLFSLLLGYVAFCVLILFIYCKAFSHLNETRDKGDLEINVTKKLINIAIPMVGVFILILILAMKNPRIGFLF